MYDEHENREQSLPPELAALEQRLATLAPTAPRVDRDQLMFAAGRASRGDSNRPAWSGSRFWPAATALATAASLLLATMLVWQPRESAPDAVSVADFAARDGASAVESEDFAFQTFPLRRGDYTSGGYLGLRYAALTRDVGGVERNVSTANGNLEKPLQPATARQILEELLPERNNTST